MLDIRLLRQDPDTVKTSLAKRDPALMARVDEVLHIDIQRREFLAEVESARAERNQLNKTMGLARKENRVEDAEAILAQSKAISTRLETIENTLKQLELDQTAILMTLPNLPHTSVPEGKDEQDNQELKRWGCDLKHARANQLTEPQAHWDIAPALGLVDFERGVKLAKSRFSVFTGQGAKLVRALMSFMIDLHTEEHGYHEIWPPYLVNRETMTGTGQLPKFEEDLFKLTGEHELYLIPTAEVPVTNLHANEILSSELLPIQYCAYTPCFRSEAGSAGRDTRGLLRQHQFDKVELVHFVRPETSEEVHETLVRHAETVLERLELPYRRLLLCAGDMGFSAGRCIDLEVWMLGQNTYREISSCSNFFDFQARRASLKYRPTPEAKPEFLHTLNGSGLAIGRTFAAILENYQNPDGTVSIPKVLQPYMNHRTLF
ncbi:MAG: serine--tRNA ligase [Vampirovibrionales bacterium]